MGEAAECQGTDMQEGRGPCWEVTALEGRMAFLRFNLVDIRRHLPCAVHCAR